MLVEAYAEVQYLQSEITRRLQGDDAPQLPPDLRLPPFERARLGARGTAFASTEANRLFNTIEREGFWLITSKSDSELAAVQASAETALHDLSRQIRKEFDTERP